MRALEVRLSNSGCKIGQEAGCNASFETDLVKVYVKGWVRDLLRDMVFGKKDGLEHWK